MRTPLLLLAVLIPAVAFIFYAGNFTPTKTPRPLTNPTVQPTTATPAPSAPLTPEQARQLTSPQRLALLKKAVKSYEGDKSDDYLCSLIAALTKDEIREASIIIGKISPLDFTDRIRETFYMQWGRVDPATWLETAVKPECFPPIIEDALEVMKGWFETDPAAALAWALEPKTTDTTNIMAAEALALSAAGDPQRLAATLLALPTGEPKLRYCLPAYFDLIATTTGNPDPAAIYENILPAFRDAAWPVAMKRLIDTDPQAAVDWLTAHANDPGRDYFGTYYLICKLGEEDIAGTAQWASTLPDGPDNPASIHPANSAVYTYSESSTHPAYGAALNWFKKDPVAAKAWLQTQPTLHWAGAALKEIEAEARVKKAEADKTEN